MLVKLLDIKHGEKANVVKANDWKKMNRNSPLIQDRGHKNFAAENAKLQSDN